MRFGFIGSRPLHLVPLSSLPLHTPLFPLFFHVLLSSCLVISSFSSFARTVVPALVCTCTSTYSTFKHRFQVAQVFTMRWTSSVVPVHLVPLSFQPHAPLSRLVLLSCLIFSLVRAHVHIGPHLSFSPPLGEACVCVCAPCSHRDPNGLFFFFSRGTAWLVTVAVQRRGCYKSLIWILDAESTYLLGCGVDKLSLQSSRKGLMSSADVHGPPSSCSTRDRRLVSSALGHFSF